MPKVVTCTNKRKKKYQDELLSSDYDRCYPCPFLHTHKANHWLDDEIKCNGPLSMKYKDKIRITEAKYEKVRKYKKKKK